MRSVALVATAGILALGLSGCFGNPVESIVEQVVEDQTGVDVSAGGEDGIASLPDSWPAEVPVPAGTLLLTLATGDLYSATIELGDEAAAIDGLDQFLLAGYAIETESDFGGLKSYTLLGNGYRVQYSFGPDADGVYVANLNASVAQ